VDREVSQSFLADSHKDALLAYHPPMIKPYFVRAEWDADAGVWVATSDDVHHKILSRHTANGVLKQAGLPKHF
jgi:hypothetical protein